MGKLIMNKRFLKDFINEKCKLFWDKIKTADEASALAQASNLQGEGYEGNI